MARKFLCVVLVAALPSLLAISGCALDDSAYDCDGPCEKPPGQSNPNSYLCSCTCTPASHHLEARVLLSSDDAEQTTQAIVLDSPVFHLNAEQIDGLRFATVDMPNFAHITNAYVQFTGLDSVNQLLTFKIVGEVAEDAATFVQAANDISGRPPTSPANDVTWTPPPWTAGDAGADERTPDLAAILQEIIEGGWNSRNAVVL